MTEENVHPEDLLDEKQVESQVFPPEDEILPTDDIEVSSEGEPSGKEEMPLDDIDALQAALEENEAKAAEYLDGWQRARAEFANYKKRVERDREQLRQNLKGDLVRQYLPVIDDLERALKDRPQDSDDHESGQIIEVLQQGYLIGERVLRPAVVRVAA
jgi:molecular chaperone GrpE (heat shock protein)